MNYLIWVKRNKTIVLLILQNKSKAYSIHFTGVKNVHTIKAFNFGKLFFEIFLRKIWRGELLELLILSNFLSFLKYFTIIVLIESAYEYRAYVPFELSF